MQLMVLPESQNDHGGGSHGSALLLEEEMEEEEEEEKEGRPGLVVHCFGVVTGLHTMAILSDINKSSIANVHKHPCPKLHAHMQVIRYLNSVPIPVTKPNPNPNSQHHSQVPIQRYSKSYTLPDSKAKSECCPMGTKCSTQEPPEATPDPDPDSPQWM
ncbi:hypothetical protein H920_01463 [Fukomys damarensis]|uniref:Uncharacterized protein n=1 Tax=Fukomys damarensis TaxID=885580 RepID=A0A091DYF3_FUKDA|nr:hypothetical protein H920_01463 [Fukomys damarensis]